jgi:L-alanine-DL-glutamate epimerase-like enolase superfamily enzyme
MADAAALHRVPISLHNVSGLLLNLASQQLAASVFDCPRIECSMRATGFAWAGDNPLEIADGRMKVLDRPGLGVDLDAEYLKGHRFAGEPWWQ